jgi:dihydroorotate dehydrogenase electron transfer subunit
MAPVPVALNAIVLANEQLSADYNIVRLAAPEIGAACLPGQFMMVKRALDTAPLLRRPFSVFEVIRDEHGEIEGISLLNKRIGVVTRALYELSVGERLQCLGPLGHPFSVADPPAEAWLVAGGVGLAPFVTLGAALRRRETSTTLFYGGRSANDLFHLDFFDRLGVRLILTTEDGTRGETGRVTVPLERELGSRSGKPDVRIYACGPTPMMEAVARLGATHGCPTEVSLEPMMGCGLGGCYSCVVRVRGGDAPPRHVRSCLDGPVFDADRLVWSELVH